MFAALTSSCTIDVRLRPLVKVPHPIVRFVSLDPFALGDVLTGVDVATWAAEVLVEPALESVDVSFDVSVDCVEVLVEVAVLLAAEVVSVALASDVWFTALAPSSTVPAELVVLGVAPWLKHFWKRSKFFEKRLAVVWALNMSNREPVAPALTFNAAETSTHPFTPAS
jgi:hypothetical protein